MSDRDRKRIVDLILARLTAYYQVEMTADTIELYHQMLSGYDIDAIKAAAAKHVKTCRWFPKISDFIDLMPKPMTSIEAEAEQQAAHVISLMRSKGIRYQPAWTDPITAELFRSGRFNWRSLCSTLTEDEQKWFVKEFITAYKNIQKIMSDPHRQIEASDKVLKLAAGIFKNR